jgi:hypothetical protein
MFSLIPLLHNTFILYSLCPRKEIDKLKESGVVKFIDEQPHCVSPLTVATNKAGKKRLCWDGSRTVNQHIQDKKVTLADLKAALEVTEKGDWQTDLSRAYHHIKIMNIQTKYLGAAIENEQGQKQYFVFLYLLFGISSAVHCLTKVFKPISLYIAAKGIRHTIFLDVFCERPLRG